MGCFIHCRKKQWVKAVKGVPCGATDCKKKAVSAVLFTYVDGVEGRTLSKRYCAVHSLETFTPVCVGRNLGLAGVLYFPSPAVNTALSGYWTSVTTCGEEG
jgi:hypothetical protein